MCAQDIYLSAVPDVVAKPNGDFRRRFAGIDDRPCSGEVDYIDGRQVPHTEAVFIEDTHKDSDQRFARLIVVAALASYIFEKRIATNASRLLGHAFTVEIRHLRRTPIAP